RGKRGRGSGDLPATQSSWPARRSSQHRAMASSWMESSWLETHWARPFHLTLVFCLALGLLHAIKLYLQRQRLLRDLRPFPSPPTHWLYGHQKSNFLYKFMIPSVGKGLVNLDGPKWFQHRRLLTPGFHFNTLKSFIEVMAQSVNIMLDKWEKICGSQDTLMDIYEHIDLMTLDVLMKCSFSWETNCQTDGSHDDYVKATSDGSNILMQRVYNFFYHYDLIFRLSSVGHRFREVNKILHQHTGISCAENDNFTDSDVWSEVNTFMLAGHDSVSAGISCLLYQLARHPEHQERCREEIRAILGDGSSITWDQLSEMPYTTMCIKESLRLAPPAVSISRRLTKPMTFPDGRSLPAGMTVVLSIWGLHHNPAVWEDPQVFDPLRFSQENNKRHSHAFLPFSTGPRNCIGQNFAMAEMKVIVALILLRFKMTAEPTKPPVFMPYIFIKPQKGVYLHLKKLP
ncbi:hypothetical protein FD755_023265, partial [Muntiacus reevesi]